MLPGMEGTMILTKLRRQGISIPVLMITALGTLNDKVTGLNLGADDYLVKPFAFEELLARIQCVTRRSPILSQTELSTYCDISFDETSNTLTGPDGSCTCSKREGAMLEIFVKNGGQTLSRNTLLLKIWGPDSDVEEGNLDNYIYFVRRRLKAVGRLWYWLLSAGRITGKLERKQFLSHEYHQKSTPSFDTVKRLHHHIDFNCHDTWLSIDFRK